MAGRTMKQARNDIGGELVECPSADGATDALGAAAGAQAAVIEFKPLVTRDGVGDGRGPFLSGRLTLLRVISGIDASELGVGAPHAIFGDEDEDYDDEFDDEDDEEEDDELDDELDDDDEDDEDDEFDDEEDEEDEILEEDDEDEFEADLDDD